MNLVTTQDRERGRAGGANERVAGKGTPVAALRHPLAHGLGCHRHAQRQAIRDGFGHTEDVGDDVLSAEGEDPAGAESRLDLVTD